MVKNIYSIHDRLIGYLNIVLDDNDEVAIRNFTNSLNNKHSIMHTNKEDFSLYKHGSLDTVSGELITLPNPVCVFRAIDLNLNKEVNNE